jgi:agmatine deiminase
LVGEARPDILRAPSLKSVLCSAYADGNPNRSKADIDSAIRKASGREAVCWLPGDRNEPVTTGHADSILSFTGNGKVLFNWANDDTSSEYDVCDYNFRMFREWADLQGRKYDIIKVPIPRQRPGDNHCSSYINFALVNDAIIVPKFGDCEADNRAQHIIREAFDWKLEVESVDVTAFACAGGAIHCATLHQPAL